MMTSPREIRLGDVDVPRVGLGTNRLRDTREDIAFLREAVDAGLGHIDTAHLYTDGDAERAIGAAFGGDHPDGLVVATKGGYGGAGQGRPEVLRAQVEQSLRALRVEAIHLWYLHRVDPETPLEASLGAVKELVDQGAIRHVGLSSVTVEQIERARAVVPIAAVQNEFHLGERRHEDVIDFCEAEGIAFVPYYPLRGGDEAAVRRVAERLGATPGQVKLAWLLARSPVVAPIPGTRSIEHLREDLAALDLELGGADAGELA